MNAPSAKNNQPPTEIPGAAVRFQQRIGGPIALLCTALIWGLAFSGQRQGAEFLSASVFLALRSWLGCAALLAVISVMDRRRKRFPGSPDEPEDGKGKRSRLVTAGVLCGSVLFAASWLQQCGAKYAPAGKCGFLTALYIVIVPVLGIFFRRRTSRLLWFAVGIVLCGSWLLCGPAETGGATSIIGEALLVGCAFCYAAHILTVDHFVPGLDCIRLSFLQFLTTALLATLAGIAAGDSWSPELIRQAAGGILFCGIGSTGIAYTLQIIGQKSVHPVTASLIMSLESVFAVLGGWAVRGEILSARELLGCTLILIAVILAQFPDRTAAKP